MEQQIFAGFPAEPRKNYWEYPKALNGYWHQLSGTEQKVLDYILRHTWGYKKTADKISLSQFKKGIKNKKTGEWVDRGIGISKNESILNATERLEKLGFIGVVKKLGKTTEYKLRLLTKGDNPTNQRGEVATNQRGDTITDVTITNKTIEPVFNNLNLNEAKRRLTEKMSMVDNKGRAEVQEEVGRTIRPGGSLNN